MICTCPYSYTGRARFVAGDGARVSGLNGRNVEGRLMLVWMGEGREEESRAAFDLLCIPGCCYEPTSLRALCCYGAVACLELAVL